MDTLRLTLRVDFGSGRALGPGKICLLEAIAKTGSISQAGRKLGMSYRRAWLLVDDMNNCFRDPVVMAQPGGAHGGGAALTAFGQSWSTAIVRSRPTPRSQPASTLETSSWRSRLGRGRDRRPRSSARHGQQ